MAAFRPDPAHEPSGNPWLKLGRILPRTLRERVFEPAYFDLLAERSRAVRGHRRLGFRVLVLAFEAYRVGAPGLVWSFRRASRKVQFAVMLLVLVLAVTVFMVTTYEYPPAAMPRGGP